MIFKQVYKKWYSYTVTNSRPEIFPRKLPRQPRSVETFHAILEAAARILEEGGWSTINTNDIADRAGVGIGSLYQYFPSKEAILAELIRVNRRELKHNIIQVLENSDDLTLVQIIDRLLEAAVTHQLERPDLASVLERVESHLPLYDETDELNEEIVKLVTGLLISKEVANAGVVARDVVALVKGIIDAAGLARQTNYNDLLDRTRRAVLGYLNIERV